MVATHLKENRLSFQKIYQKSQISFFFLEKIVIEFDRPFFTKIVTKTTKLMKLKLKLWGYL
jgi:hypothetical protein